MSSQVKFNVPSILVVLNFFKDGKPVQIVNFNDQIGIPAQGDLVSFRFGQRDFQGFVKRRHWQYSEDGPFVDVFVENEESEATND